MVRYALSLLLSLTLASCASDLPRRTRIFDERAVLAITAGSAAEQVLERLGTPTRVTADGPIVWYYGSAFPPRSPAVPDNGALRRRLGAVYFTSRYRVERVAVYARSGNDVLDVGSGLATDVRAAEIWRSFYEAP